ncbi:hypothetical protein D3C85_1483410 [compost metagenome]
MPSYSSRCSGLGVNSRLQRTSFSPVDAISAYSPAPVPAAMAQPSAVASFTSGTRTGKPVTSDKIWLQSAPFAPPPANTRLSNVTLEKWEICAKLQAETIAAFSSSARNNVALLHFSGSMERLINDGAA